VSDSISWRRFCRISIDARVPEATTLMKLTSRCGSVVTEALNEALIAKAVAAGLVSTDRVRVDTTVVEANVAYPTDSGLLAKAVNRMVATGKRIKAAGGAVRTKVRDRSRAVSRRAHALNAKLRTRSAAARDEAIAVVKRKNAELADLAEATIVDAKRLLTNAQRAIRTAKAEAARRKAARVAADPDQGRRQGRLVQAVNHLKNLIEATGQIIVQTRQRLAGTMPAAATRRVSLHDPDAHPIAKGRIGKPVEFGYKAQVCDNADGIVLDHDIQPGNPPDGPRLAPCIKRVAKRTGKTPRTVAADRGYGEQQVETDLTDLGVTHVVIPRKGKPGKARQAHEHSRHFRETIKWRTGCEGRISHLKRNYGWNRTRLDTIEGARTWTGHGTFAHNLTKITALAATK
jgi:IS5 family transposase